MGILESGIIKKASVWDIIQQEILSIFMNTYMNIYNSNMDLIGERKIFADFIKDGLIEGIKIEKMELLLENLYDFITLKDLLLEISYLSEKGKDKIAVIRTSELGNSDEISYKIEKIKELNEYVKNGSLKNESLKDHIFSCKNRILQDNVSLLDIKVNGKSVGIVTERNLLKYLDYNSSILVELNDLLENDILKFNDIDNKSKIEVKINQESLLILDSLEIGDLNIIETNEFKKLLGKLESEISNKKVKSKKLIKNDTKKITSKKCNKNNFKIISNCKECNCIKCKDYDKCDCCNSCEKE